MNRFWFNRSITVLLLMNCNTYQCPWSDSFGWSEVSFYNLSRMRVFRVGRKTREYFSDWCKALGARNFVKWIQFPTVRGKLTVTSLSRKSSASCSAACLAASASCTTALCSAWLVDFASLSSERNLVIVRSAVSRRRANSFDSPVGIRVWAAKTPDRLTLADPPNLCRTLGNFWCSSSSFSLV